MCGPAGWLPPPIQNCACYTDSVIEKRGSGGYQLSEKEVMPLGNLSGTQLNVRLWHVHPSAPHLCEQKEVDRSCWRRIRSTSLTNLKHRPYKRSITRESVSTGSFLIIFLFLAKMLCRLDFHMLAAIEKPNQGKCQEPAAEEKEHRTKRYILDAKAARIGPDQGADAEQNRR